MMCGLIVTKTVCQMVSSAKSWQRTFVFKFLSQLFPLVNHRINTKFRVIGNKERTINSDKVLQKYRILTSNPSFKHTRICTNARAHTHTDGSDCASVVPLQCQDHLACQPAGMWLFTLHLINYWPTLPLCSATKTSGLRPSLCLQIHTLSLKRTNIHTRDPPNLPVYSFIISQGQVQEQTHTHTQARNLSHNKRPTVTLYAARLTVKAGLL